MNLVTTDWLESNLNNVKIFDASWHMPSSKRNAKKNMIKSTLIELCFGMSKNIVIRTPHIHT